MKPLMSTRFIGGATPVLFRRHSGKRFRVIGRRAGRPASLAGGLRADLSQV